MEHNVVRLQDVERQLFALQNDLVRIQASAFAPRAPEFGPQTRYAEPAYGARFNTGPVPTSSGWRTNEFGPNVPIGPSLPPGIGTAPGFVMGEFSSPYPPTGTFAWRTPTPGIPFAGISSRQFKTLPPQVREPPANLVDLGAQYQLQVALPGVKKDDLEILVSDRTVTITATARPEPGEGNVLVAENVPVEYRRIISLPTAALGTEKVKAVLKEGLLTLQLQKKEPGEAPRRIDVAFG